MTGWERMMKTECPAGLSGRHLALATGSECPSHPELLCDLCEL